MRQSINYAINSLKPGDNVQVQTFQGGIYPQTLQKIEDCGDKPHPFYSLKSCDLKHSGEFVGVLHRTSDNTQGVSVDEYLQIKVMAERPVFEYSYEGMKLTGWIPGEVIQSIPFRNIDWVDRVK